MTMPGEADLVGGRLPDPDVDPGEWRWKAYLDHLEDLGYDLAGGAEARQAADDGREAVAQGAS